MLLLVYNAVELASFFYFADTLAVLAAHLSCFYAVKVRTVVTCTRFGQCYVVRLVPVYLLALLNGKPVLPLNKDGVSEQILLWKCMSATHKKFLAT